MALQRCGVTSCVLAMFGMAVCAAPPAGLRQKVDAWVAANQRAIVTELVDLLAIPNVAADRGNIRKNAVRLREMFVPRGLTAEILETAANPLVWGEMKAARATRTVLFYAHYDGQPVNPRDWKQPSPFTPISVPIVNFDNNQHGENENLRLGHFFRAITAMAALLTM